MFLSTKLSLIRSLSFKFLVFLNKYVQVLLLYRDLGPKYYINLLRIFIGLDLTLRFISLTCTFLNSTSFPCSELLYLFLFCIQDFSYTSKRNNYSVILDFGLNHFDNGIVLVAMWKLRSKHGFSTMIMNAYLAQWSMSTCTTETLSWASAGRLLL